METKQLTTAAHEAYLMFKEMQTADIQDKDFNDEKLEEFLDLANRDNSFRDAATIYWLYPDLTEDDFVTVALNKKDSQLIVKDVTGLVMNNPDFDFSKKIALRWETDVCEVIEFHILFDSELTSLYSLCAYMKWVSGADDATVMRYVANSTDQVGNPPTLGSIVAAAIEYGIRPAYCMKA